MFSGDDADILQRRRFTRRALILGGAKLGTLGLVASQLYRLQVLQGARYVPLAEENRLNIQVLAPRRGRILDRNGIVLAENEDSYRAVLVPALTRDVRATVALFARIVPLGIDQQTRIVARARRQSPNVPVVLAAKLALDGVRYDEFVLKNNLRNIARGRFRALRAQIPYKLPALLETVTVGE